MIDSGQGLREGSGEELAFEWGLEWRAETEGVLGGEPIVSRGAEVWVTGGRAGKADGGWAAESSEPRRP